VRQVRRFLEHDYRLEIQPKHIDAFGHVNNASYLTIFEEARWDLITKNGFGLTEIQKRGVGPVIIEVRLRFGREVLAGEKVLIKSQVHDYAGRLGRISQIMFLSNGQTACKAEFVIGLFDLKSRRLIKPTDQWLKAVGLIEPSA
jgi:acyl-CoA thioester hydrolase